MARDTVALRRCAPSADAEEVAARVHESLSALPGIDERLARARRMFVKVNLCPGEARSYATRPVDYVDPQVYQGLARYLREHTEAEILVGDGTDGEGPEKAAQEQGHLEVAEEFGHRLVDLNRPPFSRYSPPRPVMFSNYLLPSCLEGTDFFISLAKMKSHHLCGITLSIKNLFGIPPNTVYGSPRAALHSAVRLPRILADLAQLFPPDVCLIDGIVGANYSEWGGDPVRSGVLVAGDNCVATDAVAARYMGVDPAAPHGTAPFLHADNHVRLCAEHGLGSLEGDQIEVDGDMPEGRRPFATIGGSEPDTFHTNLRRMREMSAQALRYFEAPEPYVAEYAEQIILLHHDRVLFHSPVRPGMTREAIAAMQEAKVGMYEPFIKLVTEEEAELREPYAAV
jgi:uncharacterized protein (DUF362 family)